MDDREVAARNGVASREDYRDVTRMHVPIKVVYGMLAAMVGVAAWLGVLWWNEKQVNTLRETKDAAVAEAKQAFSEQLKAASSSLENNLGTKIDGSFRLLNENLEKSAATVERNERRLNEHDDRLKRIQGLLDQWTQGLGDRYSEPMVAHLMGLMQKEFAARKIEFTVPDAGEAKRAVLERDSFYQRAAP